MEQITIRANVGTFLPTINKQGKVTSTADKVAKALNSLNGRGLVGAALTGRGAVAKQARAAIAADAETLQSLVASHSIQGSQWGNLLGLLVAEFGPACLNRETMRGKVGAVRYCDAVLADLTAKLHKAETDKQTERAVTRLEFAQAVADAVRRLYNVAQAEAEAAAAAAAAEAAEAAEAATVE